jgi:hypothetical protein
MLVAPKRCLPIRSDGLILDLSGNIIMFVEGSFLNLALP